MMILPPPDDSAYSGDIVVKTQTYGKSKTIKASGLDKVRKAYAVLEKEAELRGTIDRIKLDPEFIEKIKVLFKDNPSPIDFQIFINKEVALEIRKIQLQLKTFLQNNQ
jgi:hypothetical protein